MSPRNAEPPAFFRTLVLGGTAEARRLAQAMRAAGLTVTLSLAGRTAARDDVPGQVRVGGFGGAEGLVSALVEGGYDALIDATHPYAAAISANAAAAAAATGIPFLRLSRPAWPERPDWIAVSSLAEAAASLPPGASVFLAVGRQGVGPFLVRSDCRFVARMIEPAETPPGWEVILDRGPFSLKDEMRLLKARGITHLVSKNSGAPAVAAKLDAAEALGIAVVMVERPQLAPAPEVATVAAALDWVGAQAGMPKRLTENPGPT